MEDRSVLTSTTYSKSVLRVAAEEVAAHHPQVAYFPAYEIITGNFSGGRYFAEGLRDVTEAGVSHVMRLFMQHYVAGAQAASPAAVRPAHDQTIAADEQLRKLEQIAAVLCDEVSLDAEPARVPALALVGDAQDDGATMAETGDVAVRDREASPAWSYLRGGTTEPLPTPDVATKAPTTVVRRSLWQRILPGPRRR